MKWYSVKKTIDKIEYEEIILDFLEDLSDRARIEYLRTIAEFCQITEKTHIRIPR